MYDVLSTTGLKPSKELTGKLEELLANYQIFYTNLRGLHWDVEGKQFFMLHKEYEKLYDEVADQIDEIAERLLQLGVFPENKFSEYLKVSTIKEIGKISCGDEGIKEIKEAFKVFMKLEREVIEQAQNVGDEVTCDLMVGFLTGQEKLAWMLSAYSA